MSGHVPKFGGNGGNFTEVFTLARTGAGKVGSGSGSGSGGAAAAYSAAEDSPRAPRSGRSAPGPRRVAGDGERDVPEPPRRAGSGEESRAARTGVRATSGGSGTRRAPRNVNEEYAGASHLPKFGDWNTSDAGDANYTVMFSAASRERQGGSAAELGSKNSSGEQGSGHVGRNSNRKPKPSPSWWCFS